VYIFAGSWYNLHIPTERYIMVKIQYEVLYPGLTPPDEKRLAELLSRHLQNYICTVCCTMEQAPVAPKTEGEFIHSVKLDIHGRVFHEEL
jgi:hypothetical protein